MTEEKRNFISKIFPYLFLLCASLFVMYYLWSGYFLCEYDLDVAESVMWAESIAESGKLGVPDFNYSHFIPFGGHLFIVPFIKLFGPGIMAQRCGMTIYSFIFIILIFLFQRCLFNSSSKAAFFTGIMVFCLCSVKCLRLVFWTHTVLYSLSVFFFLGAFILLYAYKQGGKNKNKFLVLLFIWLTIGSTEHKTLLVLLIIPFLLAFISEVLLSEKFSVLFKRDNISVFVVTIFAAILGTILYHFLTRKITTIDVDGEGYQFFANATDWLTHIPNTIKCWFLLFTKRPKSEISVYTPDGWFLAIRLITAVFILFVSLFSFRMYSKFNYLEKVFCCFHYSISFLLLFFYIFGKMSDAKWRLAPVYFTSIMMAIIICCRNLPEKITDYTFLETLSILLISFYSLCCVISLIMSPKDSSAYYGDDRVITILNRNKLKFGYTMAKGYANPVTALTNGKIRSLNVTYRPEPKLFLPSPFNNSYKDYNNKEIYDSYFLIVEEWYYQSYPQIAENAVSVIPAKGFDHLYNDTNMDPDEISLMILIFENDILQ